ncbi:MAG: hypothetical protein E7527_05840 [Ruminococcaceae bacterium]|nr:hypothetical protein [Oscillospiraceae bacterium]
MQREKTGGFFMEIEGRQRVIVSGCQGISTYTEECVGYRTPFGEVLIYGTGLEMGCMTPEGATVSGRIGRIEFQ